MSARASAATTAWAMTMALSVRLGEIFSVLLSLHHWKTTDPLHDGVQLVGRIVGEDLQSPSGEPRHDASSGTEPPIDTGLAQHLGVDGLGDGERPEHFDEETFLIGGEGVEGGSGVDDRPVTHSPAAPDTPSRSERSTSTSGNSSGLAHAGGRCGRTNPASVSSASTSAALTVAPEAGECLDGDDFFQVALSGPGQQPLGCQGAVRLGLQRPVLVDPAEPGRRRGSRDLPPSLLGGLIDHRHIHAGGLLDESDQAAEWLGAEPMLGSERPRGVPTPRLGGHAEAGTAWAKPPVPASSASVVPSPKRSPPAPAPSPPAPR